MKLFNFQVLKNEFEFSAYKILNDALKFELSMVFHLIMF